jgi:hypothetical protein
VAEVRLFRVTRAACGEHERVRDVSRSRRRGFSGGFSERLDVCSDFPAFFSASWFLLIQSRLLFSRSLFINLSISGRNKVRIIALNDQGLLVEI